VAAVVKAALLHADEDAEAMRFHVQEAAVVELPRSSAGSAPSAPSPRWRPLVGLLGTVLG
jgi:biopolymer transport protein ExbB